MSGAAVMVLTYSQLTDLVQLLVAGAVMGFFVNGMLGGYGALISERRSFQSSTSGRAPGDAL
jgi:VIT1/CCC1 family predicted Fe2+/Mn2+ transporter